MMHFATHSKTQYTNVLHTHTNTDLEAAWSPQHTVTLTSFKRFINATLVETS